ncbi:NAD(P)H-binding protein [Tistrella mobilis]|uniref:Oxidoreductase yesF n=1 Tax=Tistrella mobilis (strain KA081020-065) TaxID=1110502 RepID=I3TS45_TISMK|nr:NAD(P)H-binding protein [Tistrella mobilis]AFK55583.1 oxidoreductase yesF [Tistrella mobilis KA081020-065]
MTTGATTLDQLPVLVTGGTGKTGRRVAAGLRARGWPVRIAARSLAPAADAVRFDWADRDGWPAALDGVGAVYVAYAPDLAVPGAVDDITAFAAAARAAGVGRMVMLSGRGEPGAEAAERALAAAGFDWTVLRASWFVQNFTEGLLAEALAAGELALPVGDVPEPFIDADDIAEIAVKALTEDGLGGRILELTGPRSLSFAAAMAEISRLTGRPISYRQIPMADFLAGLQAQGVPDDMRDFLAWLFTTLFDGRNSATTPAVTEVLGRPARDITDRAAAGWP